MRYRAFERDFLPSRFVDAEPCHRGLLRFLLLLPLLGIILGSISKQLVDDSKPWPGDEEGYIAWQMSWITDFDCDPTNNLKAFNTTFYPWTVEVHGKTVTVDKYSTGLSQAIVPFTAVAQGMIHLGNQFLRWDMAEDGTAPFVTRMAWIGVSCWCIAGMMGMYATLRHFFSPRIAAVVTSAIWAGTSVFAYTWKLPLWCHGTSLSMICIDSYLVLVALPHSMYWRRISLASGFFAAMALVVRPTNILILIPLGLCAIRNCFIRAHSPYPHGKWSHPILRIALLFVGMIPPIAIELGTRYFAYGNPFFEGYAYKGETMDWTCPHLYDVLLFLGLDGFRGGQGVFTAHPITALAMIGLFWQFMSGQGQLRWLSLGWLLALIATIYMYGCWWFWNLGASYGARWAADFAIVWAMGLAYMIHRFHTRPERAIAYLCPLAVWSISTCV